MESTHSWLSGMTVPCIHPFHSSHVLTMDFTEHSNLVNRRHDVNPWILKWWNFEINEGNQLMQCLRTYLFRSASAVSTGKKLFGGPYPMHFMVFMNYRNSWRFPTAHVGMISWHSCHWCFKRGSLGVHLFTLRSTGDETGLMFRHLKMI